MNNEKKEYKTPQFDIVEVSTEGLIALSLQEGQANPDIDILSIQDQYENKQKSWEFSWKNK